MKEPITLYCVAALGALFLAGCNFVSDANAVHNPSVDQMSDLDRQWGFKPIATRPRVVNFGDPAGTEPSPYPSTPPITDTVPLPPASSLPLPPEPSRALDAPPIPASLR